MGLRSRALGAALIASAIFTPALAHEFWVEPSSHRPAAGSVVSARLLLGHTDAPEAYARNPKHLAEFVLVGPGAGDEGAAAEARVPAVGRPGEDPAGRVRIPGEGTFVLGYRSNPNALTMQPAKFEAYLREEGLEHVVEERRRRGESGQPGRESYSRYAKALLRTPGAGAGGHDRTLGYPLELVPRNDPFALRAEDPAGPLPALGVDVLHDGEPRAGVLVLAQSLDHTSLAPLKVRSDAAGRAELVLPRGGRWLVSAVHMVRAEPADGEHDWTSFWASLTLETAPETAPGLPRR